MTTMPISSSFLNDAILVQDLGFLDFFKDPKLMLSYYSLFSLFFLPRPEFVVVLVVVHKDGLDSLSVEDSAGKV